MCKFLSHSSNLCLQSWRHELRIARYKLPTARQKSEFWEVWQACFHQGIKKIKDKWDFLSHNSEIYSQNCEDKHLKWSARYKLGVPREICNFFFNSMAKISFHTTDNTIKTLHTITQPS